MDFKLIGYSAYVNGKSLPILNGSTIANGEYVTFTTPKEFNGKSTADDMYSSDFDFILTPSANESGASHKYEKCNIVNVQEVLGDVASRVYAGCGIKEGSLKELFVKVTIKGAYKSAIQKELK